MTRHYTQAIYDRALDLSQSAKYSHDKEDHQLAADYHAFAKEQALKDRQIGYWALHSEMEEIHRKALQ